MKGEAAVKTRRRFLSDLGCGLGTAAFLSTFERFSLLEAAAAPSGYKALVCVFLFGGNDGNNLVGGELSGLDACFEPRGVGDALDLELLRGGREESA